MPPMPTYGAVSIAVIITATVVGIVGSVLSRYNSILKREIDEIISLSFADLLERLEGHFDPHLFPEARIFAIYKYISLANYAQQFKEAWLRVGSCDWMNTSDEPGKTFLKRWNDLAAREIQAEGRSNYGRVMAAIEACSKSCYALDEGFGNAYILADNAKQCEYLIRVALDYDKKDFALLALIKMITFELPDQMRQKVLNEYMLRGFASKDREVWLKFAETETNLKRLGTVLSNSVPGSDVADSVSMRIARLLMHTVPA